MEAQIHLKRTSESEAIFIETLYFILGTYIYHGVDLSFLTYERTKECGGDLPYLLSFSPISLH
jgi:hypothetical protein